MAIAVPDDLQERERLGSDELQVSERPWHRRNEGKVGADDLWIVDRRGPVA